MRKEPTDKRSEQREEEEFQGQRYQTAPWTSTAPPMSLTIKPWQLGAWLICRKRTGTPQVFLAGVSFCALENGPSKYIHLLTLDVSLKSDFVDQTGRMVTIRMDGQLETKDEVQL